MPVLPSRQLRQRPHAMLKGTDTRSPTFKNSTSLPFSTISPVISCPRTMPAGAVVRPRTICWSLPQILVLTTLRITPCSHFRDPSDNFGKSTVRTSTFPGPRYTTPRLLAIDFHSNKNQECFGADFHNGDPVIPEPLPRTQCDHRYPFQGNGMQTAFQNWDACLMLTGQHLEYVDTARSVSISTNVSSLRR